jgi:uncharacterized protein YjbI with pentapeptide repeats
VLALILLGYNINWTGFNGQPAKTLWDWMVLLIVPTVLAAGGYLYSRFQDQIGRAKELDNQRETALQTYLDKMSELLLDKDNPLRESKSEDVVRSVAQARTLTVFYGLDPVRKASVLRFLSSAGLTEKGKSICTEMAKCSLRGTNLFKVQLPLVNFYQSDLREVDLYYANLYQADLRKADLRKASLFHATLGGVKLHGADLSEADLREADLRWADLSKANLHKARLDEAMLNEAILDGANFQGATITTEQLNTAKSRRNIIQ